MPFSMLLLLTRVFLLRFALRTIDFESDLGSTKAEIYSKPSKTIAMKRFNKTKLPKIIADKMKMVMEYVQSF
jgi:hypothetical protein